MIFKDKKEKQIKILIEYFKEFQITDLLGFGNILGVEEEDDFADYCTNILVKFSEENRSKRRQLLKLAKDIVMANHSMVSKKDTQKEDSIVDAPEPQIDGTPGV